MKKQELEKKVNSTIENITPNKLDGIMSDCNTQQGTVKVEIPKKKKIWSNAFKGASATIAAVLVLVLCVTFLMKPETNTNTNVTSGTEAEETVILFDVNPSFSISLDKNEKVICVNAKNEEAKEVVGQNNYKGKELEETVNGIINKMIEKGHLGEMQNSILVSVEDANSNRGNQLCKKVSEMVNQHMNACKVEGAVLSQSVDCKNKEYKDLAEEYDISVGKAALIQEMVSKDATLSFEELSKLSVTQIALIYESKNLDTDVVKQTGKASQKAYITQAEALEKAFEKAGISKEDAKEIEIEFDCEKGVMLYEIEFRVDHIEYEYEINAKTGEIIDEEIDDDDDDFDDDDFDDDDDDDDDKPVVDTTTFIGEDAAKDIALKDMGHEESNAAFVNVEIEKDDGIPEYYKVKIYLMDSKHTYKIDLTTGKILAHKVTEFENDDDDDDDDDWQGSQQGGQHGSQQGGQHGSQQGGQHGSQSTSGIGKEKAKKIAFEDAGVQASEVYDLQMEYDYDDGIAVYEIEFKYNNYEYEYEINAATGETIEKEIEED